MLVMHLQHDEDSVEDEDNYNGVKEDNLVDWWAI